MLATAQVRLLAAPAQISPPVRALTDTGSQLNLISQDCVQRLGIRFTQTTAFITGIGNTNAIRATGVIDTHIQHRHLSEPFIPIRLLVVPKISALEIWPIRFILSQEKLMCSSVLASGPKS